jgi:EAL domain-containing protein (putative c-di-GMP-specific phosphodiesterase class I)
VSIILRYRLFSAAEELGLLYPLENHLGLQPCQIVFEITERSSIKDFPSFKKALSIIASRDFW